MYHWLLWFKTVLELLQNQFLPQPDSYNPVLLCMASPSTSYKNSVSKLYYYYCLNCIISYYYFTIILYSMIHITAAIIIHIYLCQRNSTRGSPDIMTEQDLSWVLVTYQKWYGILKPLWNYLKIYFKLAF